MSAALLVEFADGERLLEAARKSQARGLRVLDAFTPVPVQGLAQLIGASSTRIRVIMFIGGIAVAALFYAMEWYSAVLNYPVNSGGRPLNSWPPFVLPPFATGIFAAAVSGLIAFFFATGLPRLHDPLFAVEGFERASQDRFLLLLARPDVAADDQIARSWLVEDGAMRLWEVES